MALTTVRQMLTDASAELTVQEANPVLSIAEQNACATCVTAIAAVLPDLNAQNVIPNPGKRNADLTNLHDQCLVPIVAVDQAHVGAAGTEPAIYDAVDRVADAIVLIRQQVGSTDVTY